MKTKALLGVIVLVVMSVVIAYLVMQRDQPGTTDPVSDAVVAVAPRPAPIPGGAPIFGDKVDLNTATSRSPYSIPLPSLEGVDWQLSDVWVAEEGRPPEFYQADLRYSNGLEIIFGASFGWNFLDDVSNLNLSGPFRLTTVDENNARGKDGGVNILIDGTQAAYPASLGWYTNDVRITLYHDSWSMERLQEIAESMPSPTWKPGIQEATQARLVREGSLGNAPTDDSVPPPAPSLPPEEDAPGPDQENPGAGSTGNASQ